MFEIQQRCKPAISKNCPPDQLNHIMPAYCRETVYRVNLRKTSSDSNVTSNYTPKPAQDHSARQPVSQPATPIQSASRQMQTPQPVSTPAVQTLRPMVVPNLECSVRKGQKTSLQLQPGRQHLQICFGWNIKDSRCDVDASAFLLTNTGSVPSDDWFVFYSNPQSPDRSVNILSSNSSDRQVIDVNLDRMNGAIQKIAFVLTINEAFENNLHFDMLADVYVRIMEYGTGKEIVSFKPDELFSSITSMTIAELYLHNGQWKFNPVGNGVNKDLAGQCAVYGVEIA